MEKEFIIREFKENLHLFFSFPLLSGEVSSGESSRRVRIEKGDDVENQRGTAPRK